MMSYIKTKLKMFFAAALVLGMAFSINFSALAADKTSISMTGDTTASKGDDVNVGINISNNVGLGGAEIVINYDAGKLEYKSGALTAGFMASASASDIVKISEGEVKITIAYSSASSYNGKIADLKFTVKAEAGSKAAIGINVDTLVNGGYDNIENEATGMEISVKGAEKPITGIEIIGEKSREVNKLERISLSAKVVPADTTDSTKIIWTSSDSKIASVDSKGEVKGVGKGIATITASTEDGKFKASVQVKVNVNFLSFDLKPNIDTYGIKVGTEVKFTLNPIPEDAQMPQINTCVWSTTDKEIGTVSQDGVFKALKPGHTDVMVTINSNRIYTHPIIVDEGQTGNNPEQPTEKPTEQPTEKPTEGPSDNNDSNTPSDSDNSDGNNSGSDDDSSDVTDNNQSSEATDSSKQNGTSGVVIINDGSAPDTKITTSSDELEKIISDEYESEQINSGNKVEFVLDVKEDKNVAANVKEAIESVIESRFGGNSDVQYFDISMYTLVNNVVNRNITAPLSKNIRITISIPENMKGDNRVYKVIHVHNNEQPVILEDKDDNPDTVTIETDRFSTYALTYEVVGVADGTTPDEELSPQTSDVNNIPAVMIIMSASICMLMAALYRRKEI